MRRTSFFRVVVGFGCALIAVLAGAGVARIQDQCGPFTDVSPSICPYVLEMYYLGITAGTSPTTYSPDNPVTRGQAAVFVSKGVNQAIARSSRPAALGQWWTTQSAAALGLTNIPSTFFGPFVCAGDGADVWISGAQNDTVWRVRASDGKFLETWTGAPSAGGVLVAMGKVFVTGGLGELYMIDPAAPAGAAVKVAEEVGGGTGIAFDGARIWTAGNPISIITPGPTLPWSATNVTGVSGDGALFDGSSVWITNQSGGTLLRLDTNGAIVQTVPVPGGPLFPTFDGTNIWVPSLNGNSVTVVRASTGDVVTTLTGNGLNTPFGAAFDGRRVLVANDTDSVSLWNAADLAPLGTVSTGADSTPRCPCSDGINFWIPLIESKQLARF